MKAVTITDFDSGPVLQELPKPEPSSNELLIRIHGSSVNGFDVAVAAGMLKGMMEHEFPVTLGIDFAGTVEEVGVEVGRFRPGDEVFGFAPSAMLHEGTWAEYRALAEEAGVAPKPDGLDFLAAGALPLAGVTALAAVEAVSPDDGDDVLIVGAGGGVGSFAVQLAAKRGATVIATARADDETRLRSLGATETIDYTRGDLGNVARERYPNGVDALIDLATRGDAFAELAAHVRHGGLVASALGAADADALAARGIQAVNVMGVPDAATLTRLGEMAAAGELEVPIDEVYPLERAGEAIAKFTSGKRGKIALSIVASDS